MLQSDIQAFKKKNDLKHVVVVDLSPTTPIPPDSPSHHALADFERGLDSSDGAISHNMLYFYAACREGAGYVN